MNALEETQEESTEAVPEQTEPEPEENSVPEDQEQPLEESEDSEGSSDDLEEVEQESGEVTEDDGNVNFFYEEEEDIFVSESTIVHSPSGDIHIIHELTLGDILVSVLLCALLIFSVISRMIRG